MSDRHGKKKRKKKRLAKYTPLPAPLPPRPRSLTSREIKELGEYRDEGLNRLEGLVQLSVALGETKLAHSIDTDQCRREADDILRGVVVFTHAYLEDFLRALARSLLPVADKDILNDLPLAGTRDRGKFQLGDLEAHRGKSVQDVIEESVEQYLERSNFNTTDEIAALLRKLKFDVSGHEQHFPALSAMISRRHIIVHRADRVARDDGFYLVQPIDAVTVMDWVQGTRRFMNSILASVIADGQSLRPRLQ